MSQARLRTVQAENLKLLREWAERPELAEYFRRFPPTMAWPSSDQDLLSWFTNHYLILPPEEAEPQGMIALAVQSAQVAELGILLVPECKEGRAELVRSSIQQVVNYAFDYLNLNKVNCRILPHRKGLAKQLTEHGFKQDGILREELFWKGKLHDEVLLSIIKSDWRFR